MTDKGGGIREALSESYDKLTGPEPLDVIEEDKHVEIGQPEQEPLEELPPLEGEQQGEELDAPVRWTADEQKQFAALPPEAKKFILGKYKSFEGDYTKKTTELAEQRKRFDRIAQVLDPRRDMLVAQYGDEAQALNSLMSMYDLASRDPANFLRWFAQTRGVDPRMIFGAQQGQPAAYGQNNETIDDMMDPEIAGLKQQIAQLAGVLGQQQQGERMRAMQELQQRQGMVRNTIQEFREEAAENGKPLHPYLDEPGVQEVMASLIRDGSAGTLDDAYEMAIYAHKDVRPKVLFQEQARHDAAERIKSQRAAAAGSSISAAGKPSSAPRTRSIRDTLEAAWAQQEGRV